MKNVFFVLFIIINTVIYSQGNLQFNQVINTLVTVSGSINYLSSGTTYLITNSPTQLIVPTGKVWKIESIYPLTTIPFSCASGNCGGQTIPVALALKVNGQRVRTPIINEEIITNNALWLSPDSNISFQLYTNGPVNQTYGNYSGGNVNVQFSIIEYNIVP